MTIVEILQHVGLENVKIQRLDDSLVNSSTNKKGETKITFATNQINTTEIMYGRPKMHGLILWLPRDKLPQS